MCRRYTTYKNICNFTAGLNSATCFGRYPAITGQQRIVLINPLNAELNPICHLLALLGSHHSLRVSRVRVKVHSLV